MDTKTSPILLPDTFTYTDSSAFFAAVISMNLQNEPKISGRKISKILNWPASLIIDMVKKRKPLTPQRAIEFARTCNLHPTELEHLVWIALVETSDESTRDYIRSTIKPTPSLMAAGL